ncbi:MAG: hypothetical protein LQ348_000095 [Seirophora lacunosa]|nr:MAG: hypothetical protein LQ348_000095 [Seirophora lacunosa]
MSVQQAKQCLKKQVEYSRLNAFVLPFTSPESILQRCQDADERQANGTPLSPIDGKLIAIKDNICTLHERTTCASAFLQRYRSPFSATVVEKLNAAGAVIAGKTNLDEFGMGALGTDTGGSVRLPAAWTGTVGFKPSYGMVSRFGVVAYANSLDTVGVMAPDITTAKQVYDQIRGHDALDPTSLRPPTLSRIHTHLQQSRPEPYQVRIGVPIEYLVSELHPTIRTAWSLALQSLRKQGHTIHHISLPSTRSALSAYYVIAPAEASSNLAKYDGVRYGDKASPPSSTDDNTDPRGKGNVLFSRTRGAQFGAEVQRRILLGSYTLSSTAIDNYFIRAQKVRRLAQRDFNRVFALPNPLLLPPPAPSPPPGTTSDDDGGTGVDVIIAPTSLRLAPVVADLEREKEEDPTRQFYEDLYTVPASLAGLPAVSVPVEAGGENVGLQVIGQFGDDEMVLRVGRKVEELVTTWDEPERL